MEEKKPQVDNTLRFIQLLYVPQTALHFGGSASIDELMGVTRSGEVMIYDKNKQNWRPFNVG